MIEAVAIAASFVILAVAGFIASVRLGMLVGRRLDRSLEARASAGGDEVEATTIAPVTGSDNPSPESQSGPGGVPR